MPVYPKAGVSIVADSSDFDAAYRTVLKEAGNLDSLAPSVKISADDSDLRAAIGLANDLDNSHEAKVTVNQSDLDEALGILNDIKNLSVIDIALNLTGASLNVLETLKGLPGIGQLLSNDNASAILSAGSGGTSPEELAIAQDLFANNMVESVEAGALLINQLKTLGVTGAAGLSEAANSAVNAQQAFLAVGQEADATQIILAQNQLVISGLADSYTEASDIIAAGLDAGLNTSDDFLDTITEYSNNFANAGASAQEFLSILNSGQEAGFGNTDRPADLFREATLRGLNPDETAAQDALKAAGLADETAAMQAGKLSAVAWFQAVIDTISAEGNAGKQQTWAADILGTQAEDQTVLGALGIDTVDATFDAIEGRAAEVATLLNSTVGNAFTELFNTINLEAAELLSNDTLNLDQKLQDIKTAIQTTIDEVQGGKTLGEAIEIGFKIEGVDEFVMNFERIVGNLMIAFLQVVAGIQDVAGKDSSGTRAAIARQAEGQFSFDIKVANADEIDALVSDAVGRGVDESKLGELAGQSVEEFLASGQIEKAQALLNALNDTAAAVVAPNLADGPRLAAEAVISSGDIALINAAIEEGILIRPKVDTEGLQADIDAAVAEAKPSAVTDGWWNNLKPPTDFSSMKTTGGDAAARGTNWWETISVSPETIASLDTADDAVVTLDRDVETAMTNAQLVTGLASQAMIDNFAAITDGVTTADEQIAMAINGNTMTASFDAMSISAAVNAEATKASFMDVLATVSETDARMSAFFNGIMAKVGAVNNAIENIGLVPTGGGGTTNNTNITVTNNTSTQSPAQADGLGYRFAAQIRGMA